MVNGGEWRMQFIGERMSRLSVVDIQMSRLGNKCQRMSRVMTYKCPRMSRVMTYECPHSDIQMSRVRKLPKIASSSRDFFKFSQISQRLSLLPIK
jgi:hypothetical protein